MKPMPDLSFFKLWNISFGFFGIQIAYALQSANISRIFSTLGADPHSLSFFWLLPPIMGMVVQPIVGLLSDRTWTRFGRRMPYLFVGAAGAIVVMILLLRHLRKRTAQYRAEDEEKEPKFRGPVYTVDYREVDDDADEDEKDK